MTFSSDSICVDVHLQPKAGEHLAGCSIAVIAVAKAGEPSTPLEGHCGC